MKARLLHCTLRWAQALTKKARDAADAARNAAIVRLKAAGESNRTVAQKVGIAEGTVRNVAAQKTNCSFSAHTDAPPPEPRLFSDEGKAWHRVLQVLRDINELPPVPALTVSGRSMARSDGHSSGLHTAFRKWH